MTHMYFLIRTGSKNIISDPMSEKTKILIFGESPVILRCLKQYVETVPAMQEQFQLLDVCLYSIPISPETYLAADIVMFSLYRHYGCLPRAEGVPSLENRLKKGKKGLLYDFSHHELENHPLVWFIPGRLSLPEKLHFLLQQNDLLSELPVLQQIFRKDIFPIDRHRK